MTRHLHHSLAPALGLSLALAAWSSAQTPAAQTARPTAPTPPADVTFTGAPTAPISAAALIPAGRAMMWISGTTPPVINESAPANSPDRFGDTKTQAAGILKNIEGQLAAQGLTMKDVVYVRAYLMADPKKDNTIDVAGWNAAYSEVFGTATNPTKTARSTVGVSALVNAGWLIEIEAFAVYPAAK